jgi:hypothetical protein
MYCRKTVFSVVIALCAGVAAVNAETGRDERFTFVAAHAPKTGLAEDRLQVTISRWSTDAERDQLAAALASSEPGAARHHVGAADVIGRLRWPGGLEYGLRYARRTVRADGGADLILVADSRVWVWWDQKADLPLEEPFTVIHVRLDKSGVGEGRLAPASKVRSDKTVGVSLADYDARPVLLTDFRTQRG